MFRLVATFYSNIYSGSFTVQVPDVDYELKLERSVSLYTVPHCLALVDSGH